MKKYLSFTLLLALMLSFFSLSHALTVQIGAGTGTTYQFPIHGNFGYTYSQQIYTKAQINTAGGITKIRFFYVSGDIAPSKDWTIYMGHTSKTSFSSNSDWVALSSLTQVFDGSVSYILPAANNWMEISLQTTFNYNNSDNLVIAVHQHTPGYSSMAWGAFGSGPDTGLIYRNDSTNPSPSSPPPANAISSSLSRIQLEFSPPLAPVAVYPSNYGSVTPGQSLKWGHPAGSAPATGYDVYLNGTMVSSNQPGTSYTLPSSLSLGGHSWRVVARNAAGTTSSDLWSFGIIPGTEVGTGQYYGEANPFNAWFGYGRSLTLYKQSQIGWTGSYINSLGWCVAEPGSASIPYKIYAMVTSANQPPVTTWDDFTTAATLIKEGSYTFNRAGWHVIDLDTPFYYHSGNLLIGVETNYGGSGAGTGGYPNFYYTTSSTDLHRYWQSDGSEPSGTGNLNKKQPNLLLRDTPVFSNYPLVEGFETGQVSSTMVQGWRQVKANNASSYWLVNSNTSSNRAPRNGECNATLYFNSDAWLMKPFHLVANKWYVVTFWARQDHTDPSHASVGIYRGMDGSIAGMTNTILAQTGLVNGDYQRIYGRFIAPSTGTHWIGIRGVLDNYPWYISIDDLTVQPAGNYSEDVGSATTYNGQYDYPAVYGGYWKNAREQYIITAPEISGGAGLIEMLRFRTQTAVGCGALPNFTIRMGTTTATEFVDNKFLTGLMEVYSVDSYYPTDGDNIHKFDTPFYWDGVSSIVVEVSFDMKSAYTQNARTYYTTYPSAYRAMFYVSDNIPWNTVSTGTPSNKRPNMRVYFADPVAGPIAAPILVSPVDGEADLPKAGFDLIWQPDLVQGSLPSSYTVYLATNPATIYSEHSWTTTNLRFNPVTEGDMTLAPRQYYWTVKAIRGSEEKVAEPPHSFVPETIVDNYPWSENFDSVAAGDTPPGWTLITSQGGFDARPWNITTNYGAASQPNAAGVTWHGTYPKNEWLITMPCEMQAGHPYEISFKVKAPGWGGMYEALALKWGTAPTAAAMNSNTALYDNDQVSFADWTEISVTFTPTSTGQYYFGWHAYSPANVNYIAVDDIMINELGTDLAVTSISGPTYASVGKTVSYTLKVENVGQTIRSDYTIYIIEQGTGNVLASEFITDEIYPNGYVYHTLNWTPTAEGNKTFYGYVTHPHDLNEDNNSSPLMQVTVHSASMNFLYIGDIESASTMVNSPFNVSNKDFVAETVYLASEIQATSGTIHAVAYYSDFPSARTIPVQIWMKNTNVKTLSSGWIPWSGYQQVFNGNITCPAGVSEIIIPITPFSYTGGSLGIRTSKTWQNETVSSYAWQVTLDPNYPGRTRACQTNDSGELNHSAPPAGTAFNHVPNITIFMDSNALVENVAAPVVDLTLVGSTGVLLQWNPVPYAHSYDVFVATDPYDFDPTPTYTTYGTTEVTVPASGNLNFYKVTSKLYRYTLRGRVNVDELAKRQFTIIDEEASRFEPTKHELK